MGDDEEPMVLGPEHEISDDEVDGELPHARIVEVDIGTDDEASKNPRQLYELELRPLPRDERLALAHQLEGPRLLALCFDPEPQVIDALFDNARAGLDHARMVARHHATSVGLEMVAKRAQFLRDPRVQRALLQNPLVPESVLRRLVGQKPLRDVYKLSIDRELPEKNRVSCRALLRTRFAQAQPEERADLVVSTEGRCLTLLIGQTFDQRTTTILCSRQYNSSLFIQNLARFSACPPLLLAHLLKQPFVRRQPQLRKLLLQHPNTPSQLKK
ncbi:MAG: hypothetical protein KC776_08025 [Myxococcales bacterium]|nr:hypothetical protein [Myxococcales bacterium]MCB9576552.1 hypothetical protein [Polyangiaceae bacterium]